MSDAMPLTQRLTWGLLIVVLTGVGAAWTWTTLTAEEPAPAVPPTSVVPDFTLTERSGRLVTRADLLGRPWVADFIFTACAGPCPLLSTRMAELQAEFADTDLRLVSFSLDAERDTPAVLTQYAKRYQADPKRWLFLTGDEESIYRIATEGLKLSAYKTDEKEQADGADRIIHSTRFVLVDRDGTVRGTYVGTDDDDLDRLRRDLRALTRRQEP